MPLATVVNRCLGMTVQTFADLQQLSEPCPRTRLSQSVPSLSPGALAVAAAARSTPFRTTSRLRRSSTTQLEVQRSLDEHEGPICKSLGTPAQARAISSRSLGDLDARVVRLLQLTNMSGLPCCSAAPQLPQHPAGKREETLVPPAEKPEENMVPPITTTQLQRRLANTEARLLEREMEVSLLKDVVLSLLQHHNLRHSPRSAADKDEGLS